MFAALILIDPVDTGVYRYDDKNDGERREIKLTSKPFLGGYEDFLNPLKKGTNEKLWTLNRYDLARDLVNYWTLDHPPGFQPSKPHLSSFCYYPLRIVAGEWMNYVAVMHRSIKTFEYAKKQKNSFTDDLDKLDKDLRALQAWRRRSMASKQKVQAATALVKAWLQTPEVSPSLETVATDMEYISASIVECGARLEQMIPVVTSLVQIVDSRRAFAETANISRLTILALVFVPVTFIASLFSMSSDYAPGGPLFWVYFVVAIPVTIVVFLIARPPTKEVRDLWTYIKNYKRKPRIQRRDTSMSEFTVAS